MKGIVFTELLEMAETQYGAEFVNKVISKVDSKSNGVYTSVGNYDHSELVAIIGAMSEETNLPMKELMFQYGKFLFRKFVEYYPVFFEEVDHPFDLLESVDSHIHREVLKLYPNAELPTFSCVKIDSFNFEMIYKSSRKMEDFAYGLIDESIRYFGYSGDVKMKESGPSEITFIIQLNG